MAKKVEVFCGTCSREIKKNDETISVSNKSMNGNKTVVFHATAEGCSKASTRSVQSIYYLEIPSFNQFQLATLSTGEWDGEDWD